MKQSNIILLIGGVVAALYLRGRNILNRLAYKIAKVQLVSITPQEIKLNVNVLINNPTNITAQVGDFIANVYINGQYVGNVNYPINRYLMSGVNSFIVGVSLNPTQVGSIVWQQLQSGNIYNMDMDVMGEIVIDDRKLKASAHFILQDFWNYAG